MQGVVLELVVPALLASALVFMLLASTLLIEKALRSRRERATRRRRASYAGLSSNPAPADLARAAVDITHRGDAITDFIGALAAEDPGERFRGAARTARVPERLRRKLTASDPSLRGRAALAIGVLRLPEEAGRLEAALADRDYDVRHAAVRALGMLGTDEAARALVRGMASGAVAAERILEHLGPWAADALVEAYGRDDLRPIRAALAEGLGLVAPDAAADVLGSLLATGEHEERVRACRALGRTRDPRRASLLATGLADSAWRVRAQAAAALAQVGSSDPAVVARLEAGLTDDAWWVRTNCGEALRAAGAPGIAALERALTSPDPYARDRAREALELERTRVVAA
jgi:HEAT repeat protein